MAELLNALRAVRVVPDRTSSSKLGTLSLIPEGAIVECVPGACPISALMIKVRSGGEDYWVFDEDYQRAAVAESEALMRAS